MKIIIHRVNTVADLKKIPTNFGVEIDIRGYGNELLLSHDPIKPNKKYSNLSDYLSNFKHDFVIFNMKEAGYESQVLDLAKKYNITDYFLLDVEFPYFYQATRKQGIRKIAVRYSEAEPIEMINTQRDSFGNPLCDWIWIDTNTKLPLDEDIVVKLKGFKTCLVCPERWGRPEDIPNYIAKMHSLDFKVDAVMTNIKYVKQWSNFSL